MSEEAGRSADRTERKELPIERGFPIERVNEIAEKETRAKQWYRPIYTMHKWWARRDGAVFRSICLYSLLDDPEMVDVYEPGDNGDLSDFGGGHNNVENLIENVDLADPESLWELYPKDVRIKNKKILDPFMGGGTSLVEASRFGVESDGYDLNPVAWFVSKKELDAGQTDVEELEEAFQQIKQDVAGEILQYYKTSCPNGDHDADVMYYFWVKELDCISCGSTVPLFKDYRVGKGRYENDDKYNVLCPDCESIVLVDDWKSHSTCDDCGHEFVPSEGTVDRGYVCQDCGQKYGILDGTQEQGKAEERLYALEYYCPTCDSNGLSKSDVKGYKSITEEDISLYEEASERWNSSEELRKFVPSENIPEGIKTDSTLFEGSIGGGHNVLRHGITRWTDMFNERQLLCLSILMRSISDIKNNNLREYLLMNLSESLNYNSLMSVYNPAYNKNTNIFKSNSFDPPTKPVENNVWGTKFGTGTFTAMWDMTKRGVEYAQAPTERYIDNGETRESEPFNQPIGRDSSIHCGDARNIEGNNEYDAVISDPPYYDNVIYSELSDFFYVWQRILLKDEYEWFEAEKTPRDESIVANPAAGKGEAEFEDEIRQAFNSISKALKEDGVLVFTYHHSGVESWGELLSALCDVGFEVTATYPISADSNKFFEGEAVEFDIVIVARPAGDRQPVSWNSLRRNIVRTAKQTHQRLTEDRELSEGDIGVIEMGRAFHEYSKHHGEVQRDGKVMSAKEVVDEIYGIIQQGSDIGEVDVFLDLLEIDGPTYSDLNMLTRGTSANPDEMKEIHLYRMDSGEFILGTWEDEKRLAYVQERVSEDEDGLTPLDKAQFLRHRYEHGKSIQDYLEAWTVSDDLRKLCDELADASGDDVYRRILGGDRSIGDY
ncbi:DUF1156 domain-containing protein [Halorubrum sp. CGM4_25_10-8A]|uniref:DUF1156 domain-containing protein n=1 Tax=Halorubrum sp. CGM4_25_10-8A TaxID=2518116 RepID=UPI0010F94540|nr:DUF1156 domain-containing protein [Halorubrum sp. CGM4_25_10-8A]TKX40030.1 DUF1156 domain-containing protein [Halorubrum sp. CGM4_25_10-8A]